MTTPTARQIFDEENDNIIEEKQSSSSQQLLDSSKVLLPIMIVALILGAFFFLQTPQQCIPIPQSHSEQLYPDVNMAQALQMFKSAKKEIKPAVFNPTQTPNGLSYLKRSETQVFTFPTPQWTEDHPSLINQSQFKGQQEINEFIDKELKGCYNAIAPTSRILNNQRIFGWSLFNNPSNQKYMQAQYYYYDKKYHISQYDKELGMCVVGSGRNLYTRGLYKQFFLSMDRQNYSNFHIVWIDDASTDNSTAGIYAFINTYTPRLRSRVSLVRNKQNIGAFANKDSGIKEHCQKDQIVIDIDADDSIVGHQAFKLINAGYQSRKDIWVVYSAYFGYKNGKPYRGISSKPMEISSESYRKRRNYWATSHLKTYLAVLHEKVPFQYLSEIHEDPKNGSKYIKYQRHGSDQCMMINVVQLAGNDRILHIPEPLYAYRMSEAVQTDSYCHRLHQFYDELKSRVKVPLQVLDSLEDTAKPIQNYSPPYSLIQRYNREKQIYMKMCIST